MRPSSIQNNPYIDLKKMIHSLQTRDLEFVRILNQKTTPSKLINLGTINLILDGKPRESLYGRGDYEKGVYTYTYRYQRDSEDTAYASPLNWLRARRQKVYDRLRNKLTEIKAEPTTDRDSSRVVIEVFPPFPDR